MRILFISGEVAPFSHSNDLAMVVRTLPEAIHETGEYETRILMPRYGTVSERRNRLHEVIRLSGSEITIGETTEILKVKVASIPGIRLQVYFMDNAYYFKRKGIFSDRQGVLFPDNLDRAVFYAKSVITTIRNLGWQPDLIHAFGWISGFVPYVLKTEFGEEPLFCDSKIIYTPEEVDFDARIKKNQFESLSLVENEALVGKGPDQVGQTFADAVILPPGSSSDSDIPTFSVEQEEQMGQAVSVYDELLNSVPA
ncbi:MAG: glycogen/starch synthase [Rhodothermia bacterium]|nr:MAG: glycogen/starch synthase [Rhodothermia bacterium]